MKNLKKNKGITLTALIITIIILLILTGTVVILFAGENSMIGKILNAVDKHNAASLEEQRQLLQLEADMFVKSSNLTKQDIDYTESIETIANPDRGFYTPAVIKGISDGFDYTELTQAISSAKQNNRSLIHLRIDISKLSGRANDGANANFTSDDISDLNNMFDMVRSNNLKAIVRFAYDFDGNENKEPDSFDTILNHVSQLKPVFERNKDVITLVEAGFIGPWGEMHDSDYANDEDINKLIDALLANVPDSLTINVRKPSMYIAKFGDTPINQNIAYNKSYASRIGIFNDGYLGDETDLGTYENRDSALQWLESHTKYTIFGGEVVAPDNYYNDIEYAQEEMFKTHTSYLNYYWNNTITQEKWKNSTYNGSNVVYKGKTALKYIEDHLGYRFVLKSSKMSSEVKQGEKLPISISIENTGFGNVVNEKKVQMILQNGTKYYITDVDINVRDWNSNTTTNKDMVFTVPSNIEVGQWNVYLKISDIDNSEYAIRFANNNTWNQYLKANYIGKVTITENSGSENVGFKQDYTVSDNNGTTDLQEMEVKIVTDGKITSDTEWTDADIIYQRSDTNDSKIYMKSDEKYLYLYIEDKYTRENPENTAIHVKFSNTKSATLADYKYSIENSNLYACNLFVDPTPDTVKILDMGKNTGYEYIIPLADLGIASVKELKQIWVQILDTTDTAWNEIYSFAYKLPTDGLNVILDGEGTEWTSEQLVKEQDGIKVYYYENEDYAYLYCAPVTSDTENYAMVKYGVLGENYSIAYTSGTWNGVWQSNDINNAELYPWSSNATLKENISDNYSIQGSNGIEFVMKLTSLDSSKKYTNIKLELCKDSWNSVVKSIEFTRP